MRKFATLIMVLVLITISCSSSTPKHSSKWQSVSSRFQKDFKKLHLVNLQMGYVQNLESIQSLDSILLQENFFKNIEKSLSEIESRNLSTKDQLDFEIVQYETALNLERVALEKEWRTLRNNGASINTNGLSKIENGKKWYAYFLKKWIDIEVTPEKMFEFGLKEIDRVKSRMKSLQEQSGMDSIAFQKHINKDDFFYSNVNDIQKAFEDTKKRVAERLEDYFPYLKKIPDIKIAKGANNPRVKAPAYYIPNEGTFYYNYFDTPYNKRQVGWIYIHEAMPGHHYQISLDINLTHSPIQEMFDYNGFSEGYAAYIEELGYEIGAYQNIYDELGKWEWDIIRSVRVVLDVGLNYYNWSDDKALKFWQKHITGKDDIALREIARMKRWPAQVITYKYGADKILKWKEVGVKNSDFNLKEFHAKILENGALPFSILSKLLNNHK